jgi:hypothetical protein
MSMLLSPVVKLMPASMPNAMLKLPDVLLVSVLVPTATFSLPVSLLKRALDPSAALLLPVVLCSSARSPKAELSLPVELKISANPPWAVFAAPVVLSKSAPAPVAVFSSPLFNASVPAPTPVLKLAVVSVYSDRQPSAVSKPPVVRLKRAWWPSAVLPLYVPSGGGLTSGVSGTAAICRKISVGSARICGKNAKLSAASATTNRPDDKSRRVRAHLHSTNPCPAIREYMEVVLSVSRSCLFWLFWEETDKGLDREKALCASHPCPVYSI